jgi:hypothetical protein
MVTIDKWFKTKDYGIGLALLAGVSKNRVLLTNLSRKKNPAKLEYELTKIAKQQGIVFGTVEETTAELPAEPLPPVEETVGKMMVSTGTELNIDELPPNLKAKWQQNQDAYKEIRALHEKLKLMEKATPEDRQPLTERVASLDDKIRANWEAIDGWVPGAEPVEELAEKIDHKRINANRKYISTNLKKLAEGSIVEKKITEVKHKLQLRYTELKSNGEEVAAETLAELVKAGIKC